MDEESFCVEVCMSVETGNVSELVLRVRNWIKNAWEPRNKSWERIWRTGTNLNRIAERESLAFESDFLNSPEVLPGDGSQILLRLQVRPSSKNWRDWLVLKFLPDLRSEFAEVKELPLFTRRVT
jgi:hypothetical protein